MVTGFYPRMRQMMEYYMLAAATISPGDPDPILWTETPSMKPSPTCWKTQSNNSASASPTAPRKVLHYLEKKGLEKSSAGE